MKPATENRIHRIRCARELALSAISGLQLALENVESCDVDDILIDTISDLDRAIAELKEA